MSKRATSGKTAKGASSGAPIGRMVVNYVAGEECRVAILEDEKLEELHVERFASASRVGNIYVGRVINVEPAIQAAFVDFGVGENGFLHVSDLHPRYFPGETEETTESVGHKTPRRERPPIQAALRRGDEVIVQVLKEGIGTKGPTLTSYLSIPGRFLVMMPGMDRVGVSRKVEDEDLRRKMREILDQLELPDGFGFIVRTAGMDRTKAELKRDLAYLVRLWKDMERRQKSGDKPRLLYSESDLLVRSLRDLLTTDIHEVVIDSEVAIRRAARFMKIVSPRGGSKLLHFPGKTPVFHAFGIEQQIATMNAREVPLASGGRLVIDQTEAIVAIDVNSGKSRDARDAEENAFQTNMEAVDEICRQLRLRDLGGIIINDLIDMRSMAHRREVEKRFNERLKRDRARSTVAAISPFGILEMTRQRMRGSHESVHFADCPMCRGRGVVQRPDSVASDALRELAAILDVEKIGKVELVVPARVAGELLSTKRKLLSRVERASGKHVDVRVSETLAVDRFSMYAYDAQGADIDVANLPKPKTPTGLVELDLGTDEDGDWADEGQEPIDSGVDPEPVDELDVLGDEPDPIAVDADGSDEFDGQLDPTLGMQGKRRGRGSRGGRGGGSGGGGSGGGGERGAKPAAAARGPARGDGGRRDGSRGDGGRGEGGRGEGDRSRGPRPDSGRGAPPASRPAAGPAVGPRDGELPPIAEAAGLIVSDRKGFAALPILLGDHGDDSAPVDPSNRDQHAGDHGPRDGPHDGPDAEGEYEDGPDGGPQGDGQGGDGQGGEQGEGGRRRRRRRRRRGRGGSGQNGGPANGTSPDGQGRPVGDSPQPAHAEGQGPGPQGEGDGFQGEQSDDFGPDDGSDGGPDDGPDGPGNEQGGEQGGELGEGGRRRRRRRRRRGRGGAGGGQGPDGGPAQGSAPAPAQQQQPRGGGGGDRPRGDGRGRPEGRSDGRGEGRGDGRGEGRGRSSGGAPEGRTPPPPPPPAAPPADAGPKTPKPRTLYGAVRRKLSPSELNKRPKPE
jgi:ribonuclease E